MWSSGYTSSGLAKGKEFREKLLHVQHVDQEKETASELSEQILRDLLANGKVCHDSDSTENLANSEANLDILKSFLKEKIIDVSVCSNPLPIPIGSSERVTFHAFVLFATRNTKYRKKMWWSLEKNGKYIVLQQSTEMSDIFNKIYDAEKGQSVERYGEVKLKKWAMGNCRPLEDLLQIIWETNQISDPYHLLYSNCQNFASFIFENLNIESEKWSTWVSATVDLIRGRKKKTAIELNTVMYQSILQDDKFDYCKAMIDGRRKDFEKLTNNLTIESLNGVDCQGYTLLEWATVFSTSHWPIDEELKKKGAQIPSDEGSFRRNLFFIALQYLPSNKKSKLFDSYDGIDIHGVNKTKDTALHLALYGEKWKIAENILRKLEDYHVNLTNSLGDTPLHLATKLINCDIGLFKKILNRTNSENVKKADGNGWTALHYAIGIGSDNKVEELLAHKDVDVNIKGKFYYTPLHLASRWTDIPMALFKIILQRSDNINAQDINGNTALHFAIFFESGTAAKELLNHEKVNVNVASNETNILPLYLATKWKDIPMDLFQIILEKTENINAQDEDGWTALHCAIGLESESKVKELLSHEDVDVNVESNSSNTTALHLASAVRTDIPMDLFQIIIDKSTNINAQNKNGNTALYFAIYKKSEIKVEKLLAHKDVDINIKGQFNRTVLHLASRWTYIPMDLFQIILERSSSDTINAQDKYGNTALHLAFLYDFQEAIKMLLEDDRVDINVKNNENRTAHHYSRWNRILIAVLQMFKIKSTDIVLILLCCFSLMIYCNCTIPFFWFFWFFFYIFYIYLYVSKRFFILFMWYFILIKL